MGLVALFWYTKDFLDSFTKKVCGLFMQLPHEKQRRQKLTEFLTSLRSEKIFSGKTYGNNPPPDYKFFTKVLQKGMELSRTYGAPNDKLICDLRHGLTKDKHFSEKVLMELKDGLSQCLIITVMTWGFSLLCWQMAKIQVGLGVKMYMVGSHLLGPLTLYSIFLLARRSYFLVFGDYFLGIYQLRSLIELGLPLTECFKESEVKTLILQKKDKSCEHIRQQLTVILNNLHESGEEVTESLNELIQDIWYLHERQFTKFHKFFTFMKFLTIVVFYLSTYFVFLLSGIKNLLFSV